MKPTPTFNGLREVNEEAQDLSESRLTPEQKALARTISTKIVRRMQDEGNKALGEALNVDPSRVSRYKEQVERFSELLVLLDLKVVPAKHHAFNPKTVNTLMHLAKLYLKDKECAEELDGFEPLDDF